MKRGFKGILIAGAIALLVGLGMIVAGIAAGASWSDVGNVIFSGKYSIGPNKGWGISYNKDVAGSKLDGESNILDEIDASSIKQLTISMAAGDLDIKEGSSQYFQVVNNESRGECYIEHDGDELEITIKGRHGNSVGAKATVWIPKGLEIDDLEIRTGAGKVETENLSADKLKLSVGAGQIVAKDINANDLDIEVDAGEFKGNGKIVADVADLKVAAGSLKVSLLESKSADVKVDIGHIGVKFAGAESDYNIDADCDIGEIRIGGKSYHMGKNHHSLNSNSDNTIEIECNIGQATIDFEN